jgi:DNA-binding NarL/FixJ family response regulator
MSNAMTNKLIAFAVVEDQHELRKSLVDWLGRAPGLRCVGAHATGEEALKNLPKEYPDVVLMDINLPGMGGIQCVSRLKQLLPETDVLMLTTYDRSEMIFDSLRAGATGYLLKNQPLEELVQALQQVRAGGSPMSLKIARKVIGHFQGARKIGVEIEQLTSRELEILQLLTKGFLYKEIASQLGVTLSTIQSHVAAVYKKLHVHTRAEATMKYAGK